MDVLRQEIATRRLNKQDYCRVDDFLQSLLHLRSQQELSDELILDNILTLIIAGKMN